MSWVIIYITSKNMAFIVEQRPSRLCDLLSSRPLERVITCGATPSMFIYSVGDYMMPQVDRGLVMWQVQADWQY